MYNIIEDLPMEIFGIELTGDRTRIDYEKLNAQVEEYLKHQDLLRFLVVMHEFDQDAFYTFWKSVHLNLKHYPEMKKAAIITEKQNLSTVGKILVLVSPDKITSPFDFEDRKTAEEWLMSRK